MSNFIHTFTDDDAGKTFRLTASLLNNQSITDSITIKCNKKPVKPEEPEIIEDVTTSYPDGLSASYFSILYNTMDSPVYGDGTPLNINQLNEDAKVYMSNLYPDQKEEIATKNYYGKDDYGIYVVVPKSIENQTDSPFNNRIYVYNEDKTIIFYKVYIKGVCYIVDVGSLDNNINLTLANGYVYDIQNTLYLFLNTMIKMIYFKTNDDGSIDYSYFKETPSDSYRLIQPDNSIYVTNGYYLEHFATSDGSIQTKSLSDSSVNNTMMVTGGVIDSIITSNSVVNINHFIGGPNVSEVVFSDNLLEIGDYAFAGSALSGTIRMASKEPKIQKIGKYAFANCPNLKLFSEIEGQTILPKSITYIDEYAFFAAPGIKYCDFTQCTSLRYVGKKAFSKCGNLGTVKYLLSQIEPDEITYTRLLYLPPDKGTDGNYVPREITGIAGSKVTAKYVYNYTQWIADAETDEEIAKRTEEANDTTNNNFCFLEAGPSSITWICQAG